MSNLSDILLAIRALGPEDIRAFAETAKLAITEEERRRLDAIPPIPEVDEAREIPVTSTYPLIYISNEDLTNATHKITPNAMFPDKPTKTLVQNIDTPVIVGSGKSNGGYLNTNFSIVCYKSLPANYMLLIGNVYDGRPGYIRHENKQYSIGGKSSVCVFHSNWISASGNGRSSI